ncbi:6589_t:CDS:2, partial [Dentiscutata heterogama]
VNGGIFNLSEENTSKRKEDDVMKRMNGSSKTILKKRTRINDYFLVRDVVSQPSNDSSDVLPPAVPTVMQKRSEVLVLQ